VAGNEIGDLKFKVDADTAPAQSRIEALKAQAADKPATEGPFTLGKSEEEIDAWIQSLKDAKNETEGMAGAAEKGFGEGGLGGKLKATKKLYGEQVEVVQGLIGKFAAIGGIATLAYSAGKAIREFIVEALRDGADIAAELKDKIDFTDSTDSAKQLQKAIQDVEGDIAATGEAIDENKNRLYYSAMVNEYLVNKQRQNEQELANLRRSLSIQESDAKNKALLKNAEEEKKKAKEKQERDADDQKRADEERVRNEQAAADQVASLQKKAAYDVMIEEQKIDADAQTARDELFKAHNKMSAEDRLANEQDLADAVEAINVRQERAFQRIADERNKHIEEINKKMEESAKRVGDAWVSSFRSIREASNSVFNTDQAASMVQFSQQMMVSATIAHANMNRIVVEGVG